MTRAIRKPSSVAIWAWIITCALAAMILWGTLKSPGGGESSLPLNDKQIHALAFAVLVIPLSFAASHLIPRLALAALLFGGLIELIQPSFGRSGDWGDWLADAVGIAAGVGIALWLKNRGKKNLN